MQRSVVDRRRARSRNLLEMVMEIVFYRLDVAVGVGSSIDMAVVYYRKYTEGAIGCTFRRDRRLLRSITLQVALSRFRVNPIITHDVVAETLRFDLNGSFTEHNMTCIV